MYETTTKSHYQKYGAPDTNPFPEKIIPGSSGFIRDVKLHIPKDSDVKQLWHSNLECKDCPEPHRPLLYKLNNKHRISKCYGDTEYKTKHDGKQLPSDLSILHMKDVGCLEPSGHVKNKNWDPIIPQAPSTFLRKIYCCMLYVLTIFI